MTIDRGRMVFRFCLYSVLKNLRFFEPFFILYLLSGPEHGGPSLSYFQIGTLVGYQKSLTGLLEIPSGVMTDRWGRRRALALTFGCYVIAFPLYAMSTWLHDGQQWFCLYMAQTFFGLGEVFRTGSHKAIMLDWADQQGKSADTTHLIGLTRFFSKASAGSSALTAGLILYLVGDYRWLFWAATLPAGLGVLLMLSYPRYLEGEMSRAQSPAPYDALHEAVHDAPKHAPHDAAHDAPHEASHEASNDALPGPTWIARFKNLWAAPGIAFLLLQSSLLESQIHLAQLYLQPFLKSALHASNVAMVGGMGAILVGIYYLVQNLLGGISSILAPPLEKKLGSPHRALQLVYVAVLLCCAVLAATLFAGWFVLGVVGFIALVMLQNARRPIFVAQFNRVMDKPQRATTLSIESQLRTWSVAFLAPITGYLVDHHGLPWAFLTIVLMLLAGLMLNVLSKGSQASQRRLRYSESG